MSRWDQLRNPQGASGARLVLGLGAFTLWLVMAAIVGAIAIGGDGEEGDDVLAGGGFEAGSGQAADGLAVDPSATTVAGDPAAAAAAAAAAGQAGSGAASGQAAQGGAAAPSGPGDRTGVSQSEIKVGVHAPITFSGVPLNLAEDPIKGLHAYIKFLNDNGGINGRKITLQLADDRFDTPGAQAAANALINDGKNFFVSGTLGIDQVAVVAAEAQKRGVPYMAAGGAEERPIPGMFQLATSYTTHVQKLADFIATDANLKGKRVGILVSDSEYIKPVAETFKKALEAKGQTVSTIVANQKPAQNPDYNGYILQFRQANTEVVVPLTDPLTTQQIVQRCAAGAACGWTYSFSNFAHDSDTAVALMSPTWATQKVRGLSGSCYYMAPEVEGDRCGAMKTAREQYIAVNGAADWQENGSGAAAGYQIVGFFKGALAAPGADLTRERFRSALAAYAGYSDLVTGPITHSGSRNLMHGADLMTVLEAQSNNKFKMISPGFVDGF
jgi:ABC-type branched-subunit amino acid transport system substrate-binding protein